jgi:hypothetical protein
MGSITLWIEITISGFFYMLALFFIALRIFGIRDFNFIAEVKDFVTWISVGIAIASYVSGVLALKLLPTAWRKIVSIIRHILRRKQLSDVKTDTTRHYANLVKVWQYGSERLNKELDFQFSLRILFGLLAVGIPLSGISFLVWSWDTIVQDFATSVLILSLFLGVTSYTAYRRQRAHHKETQQAAFDEMDRLSKAKR